MRINRSWRDAVHDLECCVHPGLAAVTLPKTAGPADLAVVAEVGGARGPERGIAAGSVGIVAQVETAAGLLAMERAERFTSRLVALTLGPEDFALDLGVEPTPANLLEPLRRCVLIARASGAVPLGFARTIGDYDDLEALGKSVRQADALGLRGAFCIHPKQVAVLNEGFRPSASEVERAGAVVECFEGAQAAGLGVASLGGQMIDKPVYERGRLVLSWARP